MFVRPPSKNKKKKEAISHFVNLTSCRRQSHSAGHVPTEGKRQKATVGVGSVRRCRNTRSAVRGTQSSLTAGKRGITTTEQPSSWEVSNHLWRNRDEAVNCIRLLKSAMQKKTLDRTAKQVKVLLSYLTAVWKHVGSHHDYKLKSAPIGRVIISPSLSKYTSALVLHRLQFCKQFSDFQ